ncbi:Putative papain-like cysteine peptidase (DUF1796) [Desulfitobacterium dehalogenans ATCC 51507]|uniref:Putative papain-like cysteine peptidase (DUF1796) n=1 Tax=Desulfitobacterium dehalogenans (strain ATCC 51507 / DSM 9161 / JW/IU-DC1) TaxID=756499 RepID=I4ABV0_DESDJ|nr:DUF1796 family putative cysteine peptidase [Desulfitobacterium dehalogenans]AFM01435.1 Putative papain-like cysteine peptidase (DUF1796) [Desulfitobacterium dehalogenans ATCC 51507]
MRLQDLKGTYDAVYSLGDLCLGSIQLEKNNLRPYSGVLDWMASPALSDVNRLLKNRFIGFMDLPNLRIIGYAGEKNICVSDDAYHMVSNHDFEIGKNSLSHLGSYAEVKEKFDRRIHRFLEKAATCQRMLFVRTEGDLGEAKELVKVLSALVRNDFRVLLVNHTNVQGLVEDDWPLDKVCAIQLPAENKFTANDHFWTKMLKDIDISNKE